MQEMRWKREGIIQKKAILCFTADIRKIIEERVPQQILNWIPTGRRNAGRPKTRWKCGVLRPIQECGLRDGDWKDRLRWRFGVERRCHTSQNDS
jgi:hypothetical protein